MLDYPNIIKTADKEVRDPVSGHSFPLSASDLQRINRDRSDERSQKSIMSQVLSLLK